MWFKNSVWILLLFALSLSFSNARRIRVHQLPQEEDEEDTVQYYAEDPRDANQRVVYISSADQYNGLYGQPTASSRSSQEQEYVPVSRSKSTLRTKEAPKQPPVQTIRNYNKVNDDGSFTFGYEAADGSFKEETRGTDCVVRGKYGYVDPDGNKREFTYVSGNPCDPNAPKDDPEDPETENESREQENVPANYPTRPIRPVRPTYVQPTPKPPTTLFQQNYEREEEEQPVPEQVLRQQPIRRPQYISRPQYVENTEEQSQTYNRQYVSSTPAPVYYSRSVTPVSITPKPVTVSTAAQTQLPATTYRPQILQVSVTPKPALLYHKNHLGSTPSPLRNHVDFDSEFQRFQTDNHIAPTASPALRTSPKPGSKGPIYSSALVYDAATGQYNTQLYQTLPQTTGDFSLNHRIQPYVHQPERPQAVNIQQLQAQSPLYSQLRTQQNPQAVYQQQQASQQFQNSAQLYAQQQRARTQQTQQAQAPQQAQQFYYVQPSQAGLGGSQLEAFLRGQNLHF